MEPDTVIALWDIKGEDLPAMEAEARSDALEFMGDTTGINISVLHCTPLRIENSRVVSWRGWAVASWGHVEPELLSRTITDHQWFRLQSAQAFSSQFQPSSQQPQ